MMVKFMNRDCGTLVLLLEKKRLREELVDIQRLHSTDHLLEGRHNGFCVLARGLERVDQIVSQLEVHTRVRAI